MARESWRSVAIALGERMAYQADNCPEGRPDPGRTAGEPDDVHRVPEDHPECPFCSDTAAYRRYTRRLAAERPSRVAARKC